MTPTSRSSTSSGIDELALEAPAFVHLALVGGQARVVRALDDEELVLARGLRHARDRLEIDALGGVRVLLVGTRVEAHQHADATALRLGDLAAHGARHGEQALGDVLGQGDGVLGPADARAELDELTHRVAARLQGLDEQRPVEDVARHFGEHPGRLDDVGEVPRLTVVDLGDADHGAVGDEGQDEERGRLPRPSSRRRRMRRDAGRPRSTKRSRRDRRRRPLWSPASR